MVIGFREWNWFELVRIQLSLKNGRLAGKALLRAEVGVTSDPSLPGRGVSVLALVSARAAMDMKHERGENPAPLC